MYRLPDIPLKPSKPRNLTDFGIVPSETADLAAPLQSALNALKPGDWLVFPAGTYRHSKSLNVSVPNVTLWSEGARLVATNPDDTALWVSADKVSVYGFRLNAVTSTRKSATLTARIAIVANLGSPKVNNIIIRRNVIEPGDGMPNGSSCVGIIAHHVDGYLIAENVVVRTLADGIHSTQGSCNGIIAYNSVRETGDDMIACVSYAGTIGTTPAQMMADWEFRRFDRLVRDILIINNTLVGNYWGRGISVVGGEDITIEDNQIFETTHAAGIMLGREQNYLSFGVNGVTIRHNVIGAVQTTKAVYEVGGPRNVTGHAAIELNAIASAEEAVMPLTVQNVAIENNIIHDAQYDGFRVNPRSSPYAQLGRIHFCDNQTSKILGFPTNVMVSPTPSFNVFIDGNTDDGVPWADRKSCGSRVTGDSNV